MAFVEDDAGPADIESEFRDFAGDERVIVLNSDNYYPSAALAALAAAPGAALVGFDRAALVAGSNIPADRIEEMASKAVMFGPIGQFRKLQQEDVRNILTLAL